MNDLITVICTVKNGQATITATINSIINQTYKDFEIIIVDDGSTDSTPLILDKFANKYSFFNIIKTKGIGRSNALNLAVEKSNGNLIANIDADDLWHPQKLEIQIKTFHQNFNFFLLGTKSIIIFNDEDVNWDKKQSKEYNVKRINNSLLIKNQINHASILMRKDKLVEIGLYDTSRNSQVDYELWLRSLSKNLKMGIVESVLSAKRIHENQSFENKKRIIYTWNSLSLQIRYIIKSKKLYLIPIPIFKFLLGQFPFKLRRKLNNLIHIFNNERK